MQNFDIKAFSVKYMPFLRVFSLIFSVAALRCGRGFLWLILILIGIKTASAQNSVSLQSRIDKEKVALNDYIEISFDVQNAQPDAFNPPRFNDFEIAGGPNQSSEMSVINGVVSRNVTYSYYLSPKKIGIFTIPAATMTYRGKQFQSQPVTVEVVKGNGKSGYNAPPNPFAQTTPPTNPKHKISDAKLAKGIFVKAEVNKRAAFIGEQITVTYKLYTRYALNGKQFTQLPQFKGFYPIEFKQFDSNTHRENVGGVSYSVETLRKIALFPQKEGVLNIDALGVQVGVIEDGDENLLGIKQNIHPFDVISNAGTVAVRNLPNNKAQKLERSENFDNFDGAIGTYAMQAVATPNTLTTDEAITINLTITGNGDLKRLGAPHLNLSDTTAFEVYQPKIIDRAEETTNDITGQKLFEYVIIPQKKGKFSIAPSFTYFDTQLKTYQTLRPKTFNFEVAQGKKTINTRAANDTIRRKNRPVTELRPQQASILASPKTDKPLFGSAIFWLLCLAPFMIVGLLVFYKKIKTERNDIDELTLRKLQAIEYATQRLAKAKICHKQNQNTLFYNEIQKALLGFVSDKFGINNAQLNKTFITSYLQNQNIPAEAIKRLTNILEKCEIAVFAGGNISNTDDSTTRTHVLEECEYIIEAINKKVTRVL